jgi:hypothetical protein
MDEKKKAPTAPHPKPKIMAMANEVRSKANSISDDQREASFNRGMQLIYGGNHGVPAKTRGT